MTLVRDVSEEELLARVFPLLPTGRDTLVAPGDDAAVLAAPDGRVVVTTDVLVEGRHFRREWATGRHVGARAAVQNLADAAAMGARPTGLVVALAVPADLPVAWVEDLARGLADACAPWGVGVVGGDLSGADEVVVAVTAHGDLEGRDPVLRSGARPGDVVANAGARGWSAAGLALLSAGRPEVDPVLVAHHLAPVSPLSAGPAAARGGATAMLDVSDGLLRDAGRLARASGVRVELDAAEEAWADELARLRPAAAAIGADPVAWVLTGGEDHGLLATFPAGAALPEPFRAVGTVGEAVAGEPGVLVGGRPHTGPSGWDHFGG